MIMIESIFTVAPNALSPLGVSVFRDRLLPGGGKHRWQLATHGIYFSYLNDRDGSRTL